MADDILRWVRSSIHSHLFTVFRTFGRSFVCFFMDPSAIPANIYFGWGRWGLRIVSGLFTDSWGNCGVFSEFWRTFQIIFKRIPFLLALFSEISKDFCEFLPISFFFFFTIFFSKPFAIILPTFKESVSEILRMLGAPNSELVLGGVSWLFLVSF